MAKLTSRLPHRIRLCLGGLLGLMAIRGAVDELLGVAQWSGAIWATTSTLPVWVLLGVGAVVLLTIDLWLPPLMSRWSPAPAADSVEKNLGPEERRERPDNLLPQSGSGRIYGGGAIGSVIRQRHAENEAKANFVAVEAEIALAYEEASALARLLWDEWPYITPVGTDLEEAIADWRLKTTAFIGVVLGLGYRARFKTVSPGSDVLDRVESDGKFLGELAISLSPALVRADEAEILKAREERRHNRSRDFIELEHYRAPGSPPRASAQETREFGRRDDAGELAKRCHMLAGAVERWAKKFKDQESATVERMVDEWIEVDPSVDRAEARRKAYTRNEKNWELDYALRFGSEASMLFAEAFELGEIAKEHERLATRPFAIEFEQVPRHFNEIAESLYS